MDKSEAKVFLDEVAESINQSRCKNYDRNQFDQLFDEFDTDNNGYLSVSEMAFFIKQVFRDQNITSIPNHNILSRQTTQTTYDSSTAATLGIKHEFNQNELNKKTVKRVSLHLNRNTDSD